MASSMLSNTQALGDPSVNIRGSENEWGFGQFLPVLLLALPIFAGWESFWEEKDDKDKEVDRFGRKNNRASRSNAALLDLEKANREEGVEMKPKGGGGLGISNSGSGSLGTPRLGDSMASISPLPTPDRLHVPSRTASPRLSAQDRPRTPSRFEEHLN
jgi:hypothetical protein